jgi:hypothetical protein
VEILVRLHWSSAVTATAAAAVALSFVAAPAAFASGKGGGGGSGRPLGQGVSTSGVGTLGSSWTLKSKHDDDGPGPVAGEEFEINSQDVWTVTFADNGATFFGPQDVAPTAQGIRAMSKATDTVLPMHMSVHAVDTVTGEVIDGAVDLPAV